MLPDSETLTAMLAAATPGEWVLLPSEGPTEGRWREGEEEAPQPACKVMAQGVVDGYGNEYVICDNVLYYPTAVRLEDARLIAIARPLAEEVIRLREERDIVRKEAAELHCRLDRLCAVLDDPANTYKTVSELSESLWSKQ